MNALLLLSFILGLLSFSMFAMLAITRRQRWKKRLKYLSDENRYLLGEKRSLTEEIAYLQKSLQDSSRDDLTGLLRRKIFKEVFNEQLLLLRRNFGKSLSLFVIDLNFLRVVNNRYGHLAGDRVLTAFAELLTNSLRGCDIVARGSAGGDEFLVLLLEQDEQGAAAVKAHLLREFEKHKTIIMPAFFGASIGAATTTMIGMNGHLKTFEELYEEADSNMYLDKKVTKEQE